MKRFISTFIMAIILAVAIPAMTGTASAQTRRYYSSGQRAQTYSRPSVYDRHRKLINFGASTLGGALLGALIGGKKGALIGAAAGAGGGYILSKKQSPRNYLRRY